MKQYVVRYMLGLDAPVQTCRDGPYDFACNARALRNDLFKDRPDIVRCWVETTEGGKTVARYGAVLKRN